MSFDLLLVPRGESGSATSPKPVETLARHGLFHTLQSPFETLSDQAEMFERETPLQQSLPRIHRISPYKA
eukprot:2136753-Rhodomonas_salina.1